MTLSREVWRFLRVRKKFWLVPMLSVLVLFAILLVAGRRSPGVFVYTLF